jgi:ribonuclease BN (tRNA processing enzyme)
MKIEVLGTRGEIKASMPDHDNHSGVLIDERIMFDIGEKEFLDYHPENIFITHLHPDHAYFVRNNRDIDFPVFAPESYKDLSNVVVASKELIIGPYKITPVPTHHSKLVKSQAYIIEKGDEKLIYTGDVVWIDKEYHPLFAGLDLAITDGSYVRKGGLVLKDKETGQLYGHTGIPNLISMFKEYTRNIMFVHFGGWFFESPEQSLEKLNELGRENNINIIAGADGMEIQLATLKKSIH